MKVSEAIATAKDAITVKRVYAEPYERNGITVIPAAVLGGGAGGGAGHDEKGGEGEGAGFGVGGRPAGAYLIKGDQLSWHPAVDPNRIIATLGMVIVAYLLTRPRMVRAKAAAQRERAHG